MTRRLAPVLALVLLSGCVAEMVDKRAPRRGPVKEVGYVDPGGGEVRYSIEGWGFVISARRATALRRMKGLCGKDLRPQITREFTHDDVDVPYQQDDLDANMKYGGEHYEVAPFHHIVFECAPPDLQAKKVEPKR